MMIKQGWIPSANGQIETKPASAAGIDTPAASDLRRHAGKLTVLVLALAVVFSRPFYDLVRFGLRSELFSHVLLVPFVSLYLVWMNRTIPIPKSRPVRALAVVPLIAGCGMLVGYWMAVRSGWRPPTGDYLASMMFAWWLFVVGGVVVCLGVGACRALAFPLGYLLFMVPFPESLVHWLQRGLQYGSADAAHAFFWLSGMPVFRQGMVFQLPGFSLEVAPQCSGIHSSLVLFVTSVLAGHLFLRSSWLRTALALFVIPLGLVRNGFRILVIGQLCVHIGPEMLHSAIHRRGGPIFFALSLIPFFLLLLLLRKWDRRLSKLR